MKASNNFKIKAIKLSKRYIGRQIAYRSKPNSKWYTAKLLKITKTHITIRTIKMWYGEPYNKDKTINLPNECRLLPEIVINSEEELNDLSLLQSVIHKAIKQERLSKRISYAHIEETAMIVKVRVPVGRTLSIDVFNGKELFITVSYHIGNKLSDERFTDSLFNKWENNILNLAYVLDKRFRYHSLTWNFGDWFRMNPIVSAALTKHRDNIRVLNLNDPKISHNDGSFYKSTIANTRAIARKLIS